MENHLESAGNSLKSSASNLTTLVSIGIGTTICLGVILLMEGKTEGKLLLAGIVGLISMIMCIFQYFVFIRNLKDAGNYLIQVSKNIEIKPSDGV